MSKVDKCKGCKGAIERVNYDGSIVLVCREDSNKMCTIK